MSSLANARRLVGWMFILCGIMLALGLLIRVGVSVYLWARAGFVELEMRMILLLILNLLGLVAASLLVRYGGRLLRGGHISGGDAGKPIL